MSLRMKTGTSKLLLLLLLLFTMVVCGLAKRRLTMADKQKLMKAESFQNDDADKNTHSFPATTIDNHHIIPRTEFKSNSPPDAEDDQGNGGGDINN